MNVDADSFNLDAPPTDQPIILQEYEDGDYIMLTQWINFERRWNRIIMTRDCALQLAKKINVKLGEPE